MGSYYTELLTKLRTKIVEKRREKLARGVLFLKDNAPAHKSLITMQKIDELGFELVDQPPPYYPDLAVKLLLFPKLKKHWKGKLFSKNEEAISTVGEWFADQDQYFFNVLELLYERSDKCISLKRDYVV